MKVSIKTSFQLAIFCLLASFLVTCTKGKGNIYAEGRVYNPNSGEGIEGVEVILMRTNNPTVEYQGTPLKRKDALQNQVKKEPQPKLRLLYFNVLISNNSY